MTKTEANAELFTARKEAAELKQRKIEAAGQMAALGRGEQVKVSSQYCCKMRPTRDCMRRRPSS